MYRVAHLLARQPQPFAISLQVKYFAQKMGGTNESRRSKDIERSRFSLSSVFTCSVNVVVVVVIAVVVWDSKLVTHFKPCSFHVT